VAAAYAARHPDRVEHLILWCSYAKGADYWRAAQSEGLRALRQTDYLLFLRTGAHELFGWAKDDPSDRFAEVMQDAVTPDEADALLASTRDFDVEAELTGISCPALVIHRRQLNWLDVSLSRDLASKIPGSRLSIVDGASPLPAAGDVDVAAAPVEEFLGFGRSSPPPDRTREGVRAILFTDLVDHTEMLSRLGDQLGREVLREHERITRDALSSYRGVEIKALGDGFLASFSSVTGAVECAIAIQRQVAAWIESAEGAKGSGLSVRIGLNAGEPIHEDGDLFGATVNLAARIVDRADGGQILVSNTVRDLGLGKGFVFLDQGVFHPKGFNESVRVWEVDWRPTT
jgi:class 3 adenylate cyclase